MTVAGNRAAVVTLPDDTQILITREFGAPRHLVFRAWTTPELSLQQTMDRLEQAAISLR